jgi:hypothetical protein
VARVAGRAGCARARLFLFIELDHGEQVAYAILSAIATT